MTPDVTVIIAAYNAMPYVTRCVTSVFEQSLAPERIEIIAVDDGSTDGTGEELDRLAASVSNMTVIHQENSGTPAGPRNIALDRARARFVFFHDADDHLGAEALERMVAMADANGTDVVLGRIVGDGGRPAPRSMFTHTRQRTDVFDSRVWWTLGPQKLFRREFVERLGLRFKTRFPQGEDMPFVGAAYLAASGISILADYDCIFLTWRDDGQNITLTRTGLPERLAIAGAMFDLVDERVEPGERRDQLMHRHFAVEVVDTVVPPLVAETDPVRRDEAMRLIRSWIERWYTPALERRVQPLHRLYLYLIREDRIAELSEVYRWVAEGGEPETVLDGDRAYRAYPFFRDPVAGIPDACFDTTDRLPIEHQLEAVAIDGNLIGVTLRARFGMLGEESAQARLVLRERATRREFVTPLSSTGDVAVFSGRIDLATIADGHPIGRGLWDLFVQLELSGIEKRARIGRHRAGSVDDSLRPGYLAMPGAETIAVPYFTDPHDNLTFDIGGVSRQTPPALSLERVAWREGAVATLDIIGHWNVSGVPADAVRAVLMAADGATHVVRGGESDASGGFSLAIPLKTVATGQPLGEGLWTLAIRIEAPGLRQGVVSAGVEAGSVTMRRGLRKVPVGLQADGAGAAIAVGRA